MGETFRGLSGFHLGGVEEFEDALGRCRHLLQHVRYLGKLRDRLGEILHVLNERLDIAHGDDAAHGEGGTGDGHRHVSQIAHEVHRGHHHSRKKLRFPRGFVQAVVRFLKALEGDILPVERPNDGMSRKRLLHLGVDHSEVFLLSPEVLLTTAYHRLDQHARNGNDRQGDKRHRHVDRKHHDQNAHDGRRARDELRDTLVQALPEHVDVVRDTRKDVTRARFLEIPHRHAGDFLRDTAPKRVAGFLRDACHRPTLHERAQRRHAVKRKSREQDGPNGVEVYASRAGDLRGYTLVKLGGSCRKHLGAHDIEDGRADGEDKHDGDGRLETAHELNQFEHGALEVGGLLPRHHAVMAVSVSAARPSHALRPSIAAHRESPPFSSSSESCDRAIS